MVVQETAMDSGSSSDVIASVSPDTTSGNEEGVFEVRKILHPNFHKPDLRSSMLRTDSETHMAERADKKYSRYFIKSSSTPKFHHMEEACYYYDTSLSSSIQGSSGQSTTGSNSELTSNLEIGYLNVAKELPDVEEEFPESSKNNWKDIFKPKVWKKKISLAQLGVCCLILSLIVAGSVAFTVIQAKNVYQKPPPEVHPILSRYDYPTLSALRKSLIDSDTPKESYHRTSDMTGEVWDLVFSDEFNVNGRTFYPGDDQFFTASDLHYDATSDLEYYVPDMITTENGSLKISMDAFKKNGMDYISGMLQSWNQLCFNKNAMVEVSVKMPGNASSKGFWPAVWSLGNLARPGYRASTDGLWPYTYDACDYGITPNQSSTDGMSFLPGQRLSKCTCYGEDHPNFGVGRGAPEIDIIEGYHDPYGNWSLGAQTLQVAPFDPWWRPDYDFMVIPNQHVSFLKSITGTPTQEAIASVTVLNDTWFENTPRSGFQKYGFEYMSQKSKERDSYISYYAGNETTMAVYGDSLHPNGNIGWRHITREPMSLVFNLGLSPTWMDIDFSSVEFPATFEIDYVRIYQPHGQHQITCDPDDYPTSEYINNHLKAYLNSNLTSWHDAGYKWPQNSFMNGCSGPIS